MQMTEDNMTKLQKIIADGEEAMQAAQKELQQKSGHDVEEIERLVLSARRSALQARKIFAACGRFSDEKQMQEVFYQCHSALISLAHDDIDGARTALGIRR